MSETQIGESAPYACPGCGKPLERVVQSSHSPLNRDQWESAIAGEFFCETCPESIGTGESTTGFAYFWQRDLDALRCLPPIDTDAE